VGDGVESLSSSATPLLSGDRSEGRDLWRRSLDCLGRCDGGWLRRLPADVADGAAMALANHITMVGIV